MHTPGMIMIGVAATLALVSGTGCDRKAPTAPAGDEALALEAKQVGKKKLSVAVCAPGAGGFTLQSTNPYWPLDVGRQLILTGESDGEQAVLQLTSLNQTRVIDGVTTRIIEEREFVDGEVTEVTWNYFVEASDGSICYYGEDVDIFEDGGISHEGAWCADDPGNQAGIFMPGDPRPGTKFKIEVAPEVAEDEGKIVGIGPIEVPFGRFTNTIRIREFNPLEGAKDYKVHAAGVGIIIDGVMVLEDVNQTSGVPEQPIPVDQRCGLP
jgi:hypothetical protein